MDRDADKSQIPPVSFQISRQMDQEKIDFLAKRVEELLSLNNTLRTNAERNEKDTHDVVLYFQREMEMKDDIIARLNEELIKKESQLKVELERYKKKFETEISDLKKEHAIILEEYKNRLTFTENELVLLDSYKRDKDNHDRRLASLEAIVKEHNTKMSEAIDDQERKNLNSKAQLRKELDDQKDSFREVAIREARQMMDAEAKKLLSDNKRMKEELKFHNSVTEELQLEKAELEAALTLARREVGILSEKEEEYSRQGVLRAREIKALRESVEQLEKNQVMNVEKFRTRTKELQNTVHKELEEATLDAAGLRRLLRIKNKELRHMKALAESILDQRGEVELFFLEALHEVKDMILKDKQRSNVTAQKQLNLMKVQAQKKSLTTGNTFPAIKATGVKFLEPKTKSAINNGAEAEKVFMSDLKWEEKELVLRVLFAKMNGLQQSVNSAVTRTKRRSNTFVTEAGRDGRNTADSQEEDGGDDNYAARLNKVFPDGGGGGGDSFSDDGAEDVEEFGGGVGGGLMSSTGLV